MNITIFSIGTRGDVQPYIALGLGLKQAGHSVTICAPDNFKGFVTGYGLGFTSLGSDFTQIVRAEVIQNIVAGGRNPWAFIKDYLILKNMMTDYHINAYRMMCEAAQKADLLISQLLTLPYISDFAQKCCIPFIYAGLQPATPTRDFPMIGMALPSLGGFLNKLSYRGLFALNQISRKKYNRLRKELLGLPPLWPFSSPLLGRKNPVPTIYGFSPFAVPRPSDWPETTKICGFWFLDDPDWKADPALQAFLDADAPPVFIGFSSIAWQAEKHTKIIVEGVKEWGGRAIIAKGWGGLDPKLYYDDLPKNIFVIDAAPHSRLFPLMRAIVHHGGAGSTGAALRSGKPTLICPDMVDQPFWAEKVYRLGVGSAPAPLAELTPDLLAEKLTELTSTPDFEQKAAAVGQRIRSEQGVVEAVKEIEHVLRNDKARA